MYKIIPVQKHILSKYVLCFIALEKDICLCVHFFFVQRKYKFMSVFVQDILGQENPKFLVMHVRTKALSFRSRTFWRCLYKPAASRSLARSSQ
jgi:hypothetical protein